MSRRRHRHLPGEEPQVQKPELKLHFGRLGENSELLRLADNVKRQIEEILFSVVPVINEFVRGGLIPDGIVDPKIRKLLEDICSSSDEKKVLEAWNGLNDRFRQLFTPEAI